jgi:diguanylate cyclase
MKDATGHSMRNRLREDFTLVLIVAFALITMLGITPFAVYRFTRGEVFIGLMDTAIVLAIGLGAVYACLSGRTRGTALLIAAIYSIGCALMAHATGTLGLFWVYPVVVANFLLVRHWHAAVLSAFAIVATPILAPPLDTPLHLVMFEVTAVVVGLFSYVFARRTESQRRRLEVAATRDPLTGASNRRNMAVELKAAMADSIRDGTPLGLLILDLDHFKALNDSLGHAAGDDALVQVSELVRRSTRKQDRLFRLGGEEFGLLVPGADAEALQGIAEKLRMAVEAEVRFGDRVVTMSVGAASYCPGESAGSWQRRADLAMYRAKHDGRNRSVLDDDCGHVAIAAAVHARGTGAR